MLGAEPELAEDEWREREFAQSMDLFGKGFIIKRFGIDPVPRLPDLHKSDRFRFEDLEIVQEIRVRFVDPAVAHRSANVFASAIAASSFRPRVMQVRPTGIFFVNRHAVSGIIWLRLNALWSV